MILWISMFFLFDLKCIILIHLKLVFEENGYTITLSIPPVADPLPWNLGIQE